MLRLIKRNSLKNAAVRITVSRGLYTNGLAFEKKLKPTVFVILREFNGFPEKYYTQGVSAVSVDSRNCSGAFIRRILFPGVSVSGISIDLSKACRHDCFDIISVGSHSYAIRFL